MKHEISVRESSWKHLLGSTAANQLFSMVGEGLSRPSQIHALFSAYELNPDLFELRLSHLPLKQRERITSTLAIARDYALYRERSYQSAQSRNPMLDSGNIRYALLKTVPETTRLEAREWFGFWVQFRQGHWSELEWVERGVRTHVNFDASEFFARVLATRPKSLVLIHNHPSGQTTPSWVDYQLTEKISSLSRQFGIELQGHWIVGPHSEYWIPNQPYELPPDRKKR
jgi:hypothetical protein